MRTALTTFALLLFLAARALAEDLTADPKLNSLLEPIRAAHKLPALAGAIVTSKGLAAAGAVGVRKAGVETPVTVNDLWHLGSNTKAMTATLLGTLVEEGKLRWDSTPAELFPELANNFTPEFRETTLTQLLSHRAGLPPNLVWGKWLFSNPREARLAAVQEAGTLKLQSKPGEKYEYSNLGYVLAGAMAEKVAGRPWEDAITAKVFKPLEMKSAGFGGAGKWNQVEQPWPHAPGAVPAPFAGSWMDNFPVMGPAGTVHCSIADWAKFIADQLRGEEGKPALLKPEIYKTLHTARFGDDYAFGWMIAERPWGGGKVLVHSGSNTVNYAIVWLAPLRDFAVLTCTNQGGVDSMKACDELAGALIEFHLAQKQK